MIKLAFLLRRDVLNFRIEKREIYYSDRIWKTEVRCIPKDEELLAKIRKSRNTIPAFIEKFFNLSAKDQAEYDNAKTDEALAEVVKKDVEKWGGNLLKQEVNDG